MSARLLFALIVACALRSTPVLCHGPIEAPQTFVVVIVETPLMLLPDANREPLRMLEAGTVLRFLDEDAGWFHTEFQDFHYGRRVGYVQKRDAVVIQVNDQTADSSRASVATP